MKDIFVIWKKELKDNIRDRRTLLSTIILPLVLMPVIIVGMGKLVQYQVKQAEGQTVTIGVVNGPSAPYLLDAVRSSEKTRVIDLDGDPEAAVRERTVDLALVIPEAFSADLERLEPVQLTIYQNSLNTKSATALARISVVIAQYNQSVVQTRLAQRGVDPHAQRGLEIATIEVATPDELGGFGLGFLLPLFIVMWAVVGGQYMAVDVSAGEKERKTLEALILTPVRRMHIVFGKFFAVATAALSSVVIALTSLYLVFVFGGADLFTTTSQAGAAASTGAQFNFSLAPQAILIMLGVGILLVLLFSAANLTVAIFAKSYKEAQSYISPMYLAVILPVVAVNTIPGFVPSTGFFAIPVVNAVLLFKEALIGRYVGSHILLTIATLVVVALAAVYLASRIYRKESVLFKD